MKKYILAAVMVAFTFAAGIAQAAQPLVDAAWVTANIGKPNTVFLDVRGRLGNASKADYLRAHVPGAIWTNYLKDGWRIKDKNGTVGMLPSADKLKKLIGGLGIGNNDHVVIITVGRSALDMGTATRIYWTFKVLGHDNVSVLNGGMAAYTSKVDKKTRKPVNPLEKGLVTRKATTFKGSLRQDMLVSKADMVKAWKENKTVLVDYRPSNQFLGIFKHGKAKRFGTIPTAKNVPENWLTRGGMFRDTSSLKTLFKYAGVPTKGNQISFCNTGHWASLGWFVSRELVGNMSVKMYDGSMVEWSADKNLPMDTAVKF